MSASYVSTTTMHRAVLKSITGEATMVDGYLTYTITIPPYHVYYAPETDFDYDVCVTSSVPIHYTHDFQDLISHTPIHVTIPKDTSIGIRSQDLPLTFSIGFRSAVRRKFTVKTSRIFPTLHPGEQVRVVLDDEAKYLNKAIIAVGRKKRRLFGKGVTPPTSPSYYEIYTHSDSFYEYPYNYYPEVHPPTEMSRRKISHLVILHAKDDYEFLQYFIHGLGMIATRVSFKAAGMDDMVDMMGLRDEWIVSLLERLEDIERRIDSGQMESKRVEELYGNPEWKARRNVAEMRKGLHKSPTSITPTSPTLPNSTPVPAVASKHTKICATCGNSEGKKQVCGNCKQVHYCNIDCQTKNWKDHKLICKKRAKES